MNGPTPVPPRDAGDRHAVVQRTLERYLWSRLSDDHGNQLELRLLLDAAGEDGRAWVVSMPDERRLPGPAEADLYVALGQLYNSQIPKDARKDQRVLRTTIGELATLMRRERGGTTYKSIRTSLERLQDVAIREVRTRPDGKVRAEEERYHLIERVKYTHLRSGETEATGVTVTLSERLVESIVRGEYRLLNATRYFSLKTPTAKRLYRYLDYRRWRGHVRLRTFEESLAKLAAELPIDRTSPSHIKRTLDPAHEHLIEIGFLKSATYVDRVAAGRKRPVTSVSYEFADDALPAALEPDEIHDTSTEATRSVGDRDEYVREMVEEILHVLRDDHSMGFYVKVARALPEEVLRNVLGGVRQMLQEGSTIETARKTFTHSIKKRAKHIGVEI